MKRIPVLLCLLALFIFNACNNQKDDSATLVKSETADTAGVKEEIQKIETRWADALNKKDINALMALYADDATSMQDGGPTLKGKAAIKAHQEKQFAKPDRYASISFQTEDIFGSADEVTEVGTSSEKDAAGKETTGKYIAVFKKVGGKYLCVREIYNYDSK